MKKYVVQLEQRERDENGGVMSAFYSAEVMVQAKDIHEAMDIALGYATDRKVQYDVVEARELARNQYSNSPF